MLPASAVLILWPPAVSAPRSTLYDPFYPAAPKLNRSELCLCIAGTDSIIQAMPPVRLAVGPQDHSLDLPRQLHFMSPSLPLLHWQTRRADLEGGRADAKSLMTKQSDGFLKCDCPTRRNTVAESKSGLLTKTQPTPEKEVLTNPAYLTVFARNQRVPIYGNKSSVRPLILETEHRILKSRVGVGRRDLKGVSAFRDQMEN